MILLALLPTGERQRDVVGLQQRLEIRIVIMTYGRHLGRYFAVRGFPEGADEPESRVSTHHLVIIAIEDAAPRTMHRLHLDFVKSLQHSALRALGPHPMVFPCPSQ